MICEFRNQTPFKKKPNLPSEAGVYGVFDDDAECLYIGASLDLKKRFGSYHHKMPEFIQNKASIIKYILCYQEELYELEHNFIVRFKPNLNVNVGRSKTIRPTAGKNLLTIKQIRSNSIRSGSILQKIVYELAWEYVLSSPSRKIAIENINAWTDLGIYWLRNFLDLPFNQSSVDKLEILYNYLTGSNLLELIESEEYRIQYIRMTTPTDKSKLKIPAQ